MTVADKQLRSQASLGTYASLLRAHAATVRSLGADLLAEHGLTLNDYEALHALSLAEGGLMRRVDLARTLGLTPSGVTRLLEGLEVGGLVERVGCPSDLRVTYARLTDAGSAELARAACDHERAVAALLEARLSAEEIEQLGGLLAKLALPAAAATAARPPEPARNSALPALV